MIDFSKAPEGATHYDYVNGLISWWKKGDEGWAVKGLLGDTHWVSVICVDDPVLNEIPKENKMLIECKTEREQMLCEQVLRMCRGEKSQIASHVCSGWDNIAQENKQILIDSTYRAKPKKELVVPWEWLEPCITQVTVDDNKVVRVWDDNEQEYYILPLNLDLTDIDLPVTVKRPEGK